MSDDDDIRADAAAPLVRYAFTDDPTCATATKLGRPCGCHWCNRAVNGEFYWLGRPGEPWPTPESARGRRR